MLIGLYSPAPQSGKSTVASHLFDRYGYSIVPFAGTLKEMFRVLLLDLGLSRQEADLALYDEKEKPLDVLGGKTPRHAMQTLGTEWGRQCLSSDLWVRAWLAQVEQAERVHQRNVVADDVRFPEEAAAIRAAGGVVVRIVRPGAAEAAGKTMAHASEGALKDFDFDYTIQNIDGVAGLRQAVDVLMRVIATRDSESVAA